MRDDTISLDAYREALRREFAGQTVYDRVAAADEQTLADAWNDMPLKRPLYFVHGLPGNRNTMRQNAQRRDRSHRRQTLVRRAAKSARQRPQALVRRDAADLLRLPDGRARGGRELQDGYLPVLRTWWQSGPAVLRAEDGPDGAVKDLNDVALDTPTVLLMQIRVLNVSDSQEGTATLRFGSNADGEREARSQERPDDWP